MPSDVVQFETPENISVAYRLAGPGTRFVAFLLDTLVILLGSVVAVMLIGLGFSLFGPAFAEVGSYLAAIVLGIGLGFANIAYYGILEWILHGQTPGKRVTGIRVVMEEGFSLSFAGVVVRNIFRLIDVIPLFWIVPVVSPRMQRFGDMAAGTVVVLEQRGYSNALRELLATRRPEDAVFTFSGPQLDRLRRVDLEAVELFLERRDRLHPDHREDVLQKLIRGLTVRLQLTEPEQPSDRERLLEDLLAAYARREAREVG